MRERAAAARTWTTPSKKLDDAKEELRSGGRKAVDRAEEALKQLEDSDLPDDARRELEDAKRLLEEAAK